MQQKYKNVSFQLRANSRYEEYMREKDKFIVRNLRASGQSAREVFPIANSDKATAGVSGNQANTITARYGQALGTGSYIGRTDEVMDAEVICFNAERGYGSNADILSRKDKISYALTKTHSNHAIQIASGSLRKLMPIECERLQGFPVGWTKYGADGEEMSDSQRYKCIGNAVTVNVIADIFYELNKGGFLEGVSPVGNPHFAR